MLHIVAKRWFQKSYGNTYHSVKVSRLVGNEWATVDYIPFRYGYGDHYLNTAAEILGIEEKELRVMLRNGVSPHFVECHDVNRKRDL